MNFGIIKYMIIKHKEQRVGVFIDTANLYHSAKNLYKRKVNFGAVLKDAVAGRKLVRATAYAITSEAGDEKSFFEALTKLGIETKTNVATNKPSPVIVPPNIFEEIALVIKYILITY